MLICRHACDALVRPTSSSLYDRFHLQSSQYLSFDGFINVLIHEELSIGIINKKK